MSAPGPLRRLRRAVRAASLAVGGLLVGRWLLPRRTPRAGGPARLLVIRIDERVGNLLLTTPLFAALRGAYPSARIEALVAASKAPLAAGLVELVPFERRDLFRRPWAFARSLWALRRARYDVAIDASHWHGASVTSALLLAWTGAPVRLAHARPGLGRFATALVEAGSSPYEVDVKLRLLEPLGIHPSDRRLRTELGRGGPEVEAIGRWLSAAGLAGARLAGLAPGGRKPDHRMPPELFVALAREARRRGATPLVLWGPGEERLAEAVARDGAAVLAPSTSLAALAALLRRCALVVTNDTGPMHLAVACGTPTLALFARSDHARWGHPAPPNVVLPAEGLDPAVVSARAVEALGAMLAPSPQDRSPVRQSS